MASSLCGGSEIKSFSIIGRLFLALVLLFLLGRSLDFGKIESLFRDVTLSWLLLASGLILAVRLITSWRWQILLAVEGIKASLGSLIHIIFLSMFIGHFLPGVVGTDVVRGYKLAKRHGRAGDIVVSLLLDRLVGVYAMTLVALCGTVFIELTGGVSHYLIPMLVLQLLILVGWGGMVIAIERFKTIRLFPHRRVGLLWSRLFVLIAKMIGVQKISHIFFKTLSLSIVIVLIRCAIFYCIYRAFGVEPPFILFMLFIPLVFLVVMLPISMGGLGVREAALVYLFSSAGVTAEVSASGGIAFHVLQLLTALPGLVLWLTEKRVSQGMAASQRLAEEGSSRLANSEPHTRVLS